MRSEGFEGQLIYVLPKATLALLKKHPLLRGLHATRSGYFPNAAGHRMVREQGIDEAILIFCLDGSGWCLGNNGKRVPMSTGTVLLIPPGVRHAYGADEHSPWTISWVHFRGTELEKSISLLGASTQHRRQVSSLRGCKEAQTSIEHLLQDYARGFVFANLFAGASELRNALARLHLKIRSISKKSTNAEAQVEAAVCWMNQHLRETWSVEEIARRAGFSVPHFLALFRARMGTSPLNYFLRLRIQQACHLLDTTFSPIKTVADQTGFSDPYYFSRLFRKIMGVSPRQYRVMDKI